MLLVTPELAEPGAARARIVVKNPHEAMLPLLPLLYPTASQMPGIDPTVTLGRGVTLGDDVSLGPGVVIGDGVRSARGRDSMRTSWSATAW